MIWLWNHTEAKTLKVKIYVLKRAGWNSAEKLQKKLDTYILIVSKGGDK